MIDKKLDSLEYGILKLKLQADIIELELKLIRKKMYENDQNTCKHNPSNIEIFENNVICRACGKILNNVSLKIADVISVPFK